MFVVCAMENDGRDYFRGISQPPPPPSSPPASPPSSPFVVEKKRSFSQTGEEEEDTNGEPKRRVRFEILKEASERPRTWRMKTKKNKEIFRTRMQILRSTRALTRRRSQLQYSGPWRTRFNMQKNMEDSETKIEKWTWRKDHSKDPVEIYKLEEKILRETEETLTSIDRIMFHEWKVNGNLILPVGELPPDLIAQVMEFLQDPISSKPHPRPLETHQVLHFFWRIIDTVESGQEGVDDDFLWEHVLPKDASRVQGLKRIPGQETTICFASIHLLSFACHRLLCSPLSFLEKGSFLKSLADEYKKHDKEFAVSFLREVFKETLGMCDACEVHRHAMDKGLEPNYRRFQVVLQGMEDELESSKLFSMWPVFYGQ